MKRRRKRSQVIQGRLQPPFFVQQNARRNVNFKAPWSVAATNVSLAAGWVSPPQDNLGCPPGPMRRALTTLRLGFFFCPLACAQSGSLVEN